MIERVRPSVVRINHSLGAGSGFIFETQPDGSAFIATNEHVVSGFHTVEVTVNDEHTYKGEVRGVDAERDIAVVSICCSRGFQALSFATASISEEIAVVGYALDLPGQATVSRGIVSAVRFSDDHQSHVVQTDAAVNPGNSGGPMLNMDGEVVGIATFGFTEGLNFSVAAETVELRVHVLKTQMPPTPTPEPMPTPEPTAIPTPTYDRGAGDFGPANGELRHDPSDDFIQAEWANVGISDMWVTATFVNPYSASSNPWDYGFAIRNGGQGDSYREILVIATSHGEWQAAWFRGQERQATADGSLSNFNTVAGGSNSLFLVAFGNRGLFFVNGEFVSMLDLSGVTEAGDIAVITGASWDSEVAGAVTRFEDFQVGRFLKEYGPVNGRLATADEEVIAEHDSGVWTNGLIAEAEFISPPGSNWDYGFTFRDGTYEHSRLDVVGVDEGVAWFHQTRDVDDDEYTAVADGKLEDSGITLQAKNHLLLFALADLGLFFINGQVAAWLDLSHNPDHGSVSAMAGYFSDHTGEPRFEEFNVWTR